MCSTVRPVTVGPGSLTLGNCVDGVQSSHNTSTSVQIIEESLDGYDHAPDN